MSHPLAASDISFHSQNPSELFVVEQALLQRILMVCSIFQSNSAWTALILLYCLVFTHPFCKASGSQCFTNEGALVDVDFPCNPTQTESFCCGPGWACLPNRLCASPDTDGKGIRFARGSCTSRLWTSSSQCPSFCLDTPG